MFDELHEREKYPDMPEEYILPWQVFTTPYLGLDRSVDKLP